MTADLDLSPEAVERLAKVCCETGSNYMTASQAPAAMLALSAENARLQAERDAAWQAGAEAMREAAIMAVNSTVAPIVGTSYSAGGRAFSDAIRALPLPGQPKEGA